MEQEKIEDKLKRVAEEWDRTFNAISDPVFIIGKDC